MMFRARNDDVDRSGHLAVPDQSAGGDVVGAEVQALREHEECDGPGAVLHIAEVSAVLGVRGWSGRR